MIWVFMILSTLVFIALCLLVIGVGDVAEELREMRKGWERRP